MVSKAIESCLSLPKTLLESFEKNGVLLCIAELDEAAESLTETVIKSTLSDCEYRRFLEFLDKAASWQFAAGRILLRNLVSKMTGDPPRDIAIELADSGKPSIASSTFLGNVSISHSGRYIAVLVADEDQCGVDIEVVDLFSYELLLQQRFFSTAEINWIKQKLNTLEGINRFLQLWTRKEAYLKTTGHGIAAMSKDISFDNLSLGVSNVTEAAINTKYWILDLPTAEYCLSVCVDRRLEFFDSFMIKIGNL